MVIKKEIPTDNNDDIRQKTLSLLEKYNTHKLSKNVLSRIENGVEIASKNENGDFNVMMYTIQTVKIIESLKNPYVINCIKNDIWKPEDLATLDKESLNPEKWQQLQDIRLPKNIKKEKVKGLNKCGRCNSWYTKCTGSAQIRSADEPMTNFMECEDCSFHWKM